MKIVRAVVAGVLGALAMSLAMFLLRLAGINVNLEGLLGSLVEPPAGLSHWIVGFLIHLAVGGMAGIVYAGVFELAVQRSGILVGAGLGLCHGLLAGLMMSGIPAMNPLALGAQTAPGAFLQNLSFGPFVFLLLHVLFGVVTGVAYGPPVEKPHEVGGLRPFPH
jgi:hypothetical protein